MTVIAICALGMMVSLAGNAMAATTLNTSSKPSLAKLSFNFFDGIDGECWK